MPGIINERLFSVCDINSDSYLDQGEFTNGMNCLFSENYQKLTKLIFDIYDFDSDGYVSREDVEIILSYIPIKTKNLQTHKFANEDFNDRVESKNEIFRILEKVFESRVTIDYELFVKNIENTGSEIFIYVTLLNLIYSFSYL